jgi:hypothetical protein
MLAGNSSAATVMAPTKAKIAVMLSFIVNRWVCVVESRYRLIESSYELTEQSNVVRRVDECRNRTKDEEWKWVM